MKLRNWPSLFARKKPVDGPTQSKASPVRPRRYDMTLERWQKDDGLVNWARGSDEFAYTLSVVHNQQPSGFPVRGQVITDTQCAVELGRKEGYADCLNVLLALRQFPVVVKEEIEANYDDTDYSKEEAQG